MSKRWERRLKWGTATISVVLIVAIAGLYLAPAFRLQLAQQLGIVPGADATQVAGPDEGQLIVISYPEPVQLSTPNYRDIARYILRGDQLTDLDSGQQVQVPIPDVSSVQINPDRTVLYLIGDSQTAAVDLGNDQVTTQPGTAAAGAQKPLIRPDLCSGVSNGDVFTLCMRVGGQHNTRYVWGNWEVMVRPYGRSGAWERVYRGRGEAPIVGFAPDNHSVYMYNELGIWQAPIH